VVVLIAALALAASGLAGWRLTHPETALGHALSMTPAEADRVSWTDWADVRRELDAGLDAESSAEELRAFLDAAFSQDLSSKSALVSSATAMQAQLGFSPATLDWELFAQSGDGAVELMRVDDDLSFDELADRLESLGFQSPDDEDGVWIGGAELLAGIDPSLTPELQHLALLPDEHLVMASDQAAYLERAVQVAKGDGDAADDFADLTDGLREAVAASIYDGPHACEKLAMSQADDDAQAEAEQLVAAAGGVHPLTGFAMARLPGGTLRLVMQVEDEDDAASDADARAELAAGPAPGQGGSFTDRFELLEAVAQGREITLDLEPQEGEYVLSDLTNGPVLFATC
jgi:hypothetical protein